MAAVAVVVEGNMVVVIVIEVTAVAVVTVLQVNTDVVCVLWKLRKCVIFGFFFEKRFCFIFFLKFFFEKRFCE